MALADDTAQLLSDAIDAIGEVINEIKSAPPAGKPNPLALVVSGPIERALLPFRIFLPTDKLRVKDDAIDDYVQAYGEKCVEFAQFLSGELGSKGVGVTSAFSDQLTRALAAFQRNAIGTPAIDTGSYETLLVRLEDVRHQWVKIIQTYNHPELSDEELKRFRFCTPFGDEGVLNEYSRTIIDLDHSDYNPAKGRIRLKDVATTFVFDRNQKAKKQWKLLFALFTQPEAVNLSNGTSIRDHGWIYIPLQKGSSHILDCMKSGSDVNGPRAFIRYVVNYSAEHSPSGRPGRVSEYLFQVAANGPDRNKEIRLRYKKIMLPLRTTKKARSTKRGNR